MLFRSWLKYPMKITGHLTNIPNKGDYVTCQMKSGRVGVFQVLEVKHCHDPRDMFFADLDPLGYADELEIPDELPMKQKLMLS